MDRKINPLEGSAGIPLIITPPFEQPIFSKKTKVTVPVTHMDFMPTILEEPGVKIPENVEGKSMSPFLRGKNPKWRNYLHGEHAYGNNGWQFVTDGKEKYF